MEGRIGGKDRRGRIKEREEKMEEWREEGRRKKMRRKRWAMTLLLGPVSACKVKSYVAS